jgi:hypothetical protein
MLQPFEVEKSDEMETFHHWLAQPVEIHRSRTPPLRFCVNPLIKQKDSVGKARSRLAGDIMPCYVGRMHGFNGDRLPADLLSKDLAAELERRFFWWEPVGFQPRSHLRILAQAMDLALFDDVRRLERTLGPDRLAEAMLAAEPGWISERSWEFWRGRLALATGRVMPDAPPRRSFDAGKL